MSDLISRKAAIEALKEHRALYCDNTPDTFSRLSYVEKSRVDELDTAIATLINLPSAQRWIPCSERLPEEPYGCLVTVWDTNPMTMDEFENILPYFVGWDGEQWNDGDGEQCPFEVVAWMPLPEPYGGEKE